MTILLLIIMFGLLGWLGYQVIHDAIVPKIYSYSFRRFIRRYYDFEIKPVKMDEILILNSELAIVFADGKYILQEKGLYICHVSVNKWNNIADVIQELLAKYNIKLNKKEIKEKQNIPFYGEI